MSNDKEYIRILEDFIKHCDENLDMEISLKADGLTKWAIENILSDYKRVLKENEDLKSQNKELEMQYLLQKDLINGNDYISKQKIKGKIEELRAEYEYLGEDNKRVNKFEIELLQELLEESEEK